MYARWIGEIAVLFLVFLALVFSTFLTANSDSYLIPRLSTQPLEAVESELVLDTFELPRELSRRTVDPYRGLGAWVDSFDADPAYASGAPTVYPADVVQMSAQGVKTLYLQGARASEGARFPTADPWLLAEFLLASHASDLAVVVWYLPMWEDGNEDLDRLIALSEFEVFGHRFDGIAVDIEWKDDGLEAEERSRRLVQLGRQLRLVVDRDALGAIVMPPVVTNVINTEFWPEFPWEAIRSTYDVWLPMSYWSFRTNEHADPYFYTHENIRMLRELLEDDSALIHGVGGIGIADGTDLPDPGEPLAGIGDLDAFRAALLDSDVIGGSIYDWATTGAEARSWLAEVSFSGE